MRKVVLLIDGFDLSYSKCTCGSTAKHFPRGKRIKIRFSLNSKIFARDIALRKLLKRAVNIICVKKQTYFTISF